MNGSGPIKEPDPLAALGQFLNQPEKDRAILSAQVIVKQFLETFQEFPPHI